MCVSVSVCVCVCVCRVCICLCAHARTVEKHYRYHAVLKYIHICSLLDCTALGTYLNQPYFALAFQFRLIYDQYNYQNSI